MSAQIVNPLDAVFNGSLLDSSGQPNLVIGSTGTSQLTWTLTNNAPKGGPDLVITPFASGGASASQFHFSFTFAPGALTANPVVEGWDVAVQLDSDKAIQVLYVALGGTTALTIPPQGTSRSQIIYTTAIQENTGSSQVQVTLAAGTNVTLGGSSIQNKQFGPFDLTLVPAGTPSLSAPPISVDFVGRRTVLNDGQTPNSFTFALTNLTTVDLDLGSSAVFTAWFDAAPNDPQVPFPWALAQVQDLAASGVTLSAPTGWSVTSSVDLVTVVVPGNPQWKLTPTSTITLSPQAPVFFIFSGIVTDLDPGITRMYLRFQNLPGFADGILMAEMEKSPLLYGASRGQGMYLSAGVYSGPTAPQPSFDSGLYVRQFASAPAATLDGGTGLLIQNTTGPAATLDGALQVNGTATITGPASVGGLLTANAGASIVGTLAASGVAVSANDAQPAVSIQQSGSGPALQASGDVSVGGTLAAQGAANVTGLLTANGGATLNGTISIPGPVSMLGGYQDSYDLNQQYTAETDGFVLATIYWPDSTSAPCTGYISGFVNNEPVAYATGGNMGLQYPGIFINAQNCNTLLLPVPNGATWQVELTAAPPPLPVPSTSIFWIAFGTSKQGSALAAGVQQLEDLPAVVPHAQESDVRANIASLMDELGAVLGRPITGDAASRLQESIYRLVQVKSAGGA